MSPQDFIFPVRKISYSARSGPFQNVFHIAPPYPMPCGRVACEVAGRPAYPLRDVGTVGTLVKIARKAAPLLGFCVPKAARKKRGQSANVPGDVAATVSHKAS